MSDASAPCVHSEVLVDERYDGSLSCPIDLAVLERASGSDRSGWRCPVCDWQTTTR